MSLSVLSFSLRSKPARLLFLAAIFTFLIFTYSEHLPAFLLPDIFSPHSSSCPPTSWNDGQWTYNAHTNLTRMTKKEDALEFAGFQGCASDREFFWHLASDTESQWGRWPGVASHQWTPADQGCDSVRPLDGAALVKDLAERGGWLLLGGKLHYTLTTKSFKFMPCLFLPQTQ